MAAGNLMKEFCDEVTCSICLEYFTEPVMIECGHNFCRACLMQCWEKSKTAVSCPQCRENIQHRDFRLNRQLVNLLEIAKKFQEEKRAGDKSGVCKEHQEPLKLFCKDDLVSICVVCDRSKKHQNHRVLPMEEAFKEYKELEEGRSSGITGRNVPEENVDLRELRIQQLYAEYLKLANHLEKMKEQEEVQAWAPLPPPWAQLNPQMFPVYKEGDDVAAFFTIFEMACEEAGVTGKQRMVLLRMQVSGSLMELIKTLPRALRSDYDHFKKLVKTQYGLSAEQCRKRFRRLTKEPAETFTAFNARLLMALNAWLDAEGANDLDKIRDLMVKEQLYQQFPEEYDVWTAVENPGTSTEAAQMADRLRAYGKRNPLRSGAAEEATKA